MKSESTIHLELPASHSHLNILDVCITELLGQVEQMPNPGVTINDIRVAVQETWNTIVEHAYAHTPHGRVQVSLKLDDTARHIVIEFHDTGTSFDFDIAHIVAVPDPEHVEEQTLGLFLLYTLMDEVVYVPRPSENFWRLMKHLA